MLIYIDGEFLPKEEAKISVFDHGLLYGDGVFEGIRSYKGRVFRLDEHLQRLYDSAKAIMLEIPISIENMEEAVLKTLRRNQLHDAYIRLVVTRGVGDLGLDPDKCPVPTIVIITDKITLYPPNFYEEGLEIVTVSVRRNYAEAISPRIKSLNYLNNILAKIEGKQAGVEEVLMLNAEGYVVECSGDNIFFVKDNVIVTPPPPSRHFGRSYPQYSYRLGTRIGHHRRRKGVYTTRPVYRRRMLPYGNCCRSHSCC